jgi:ketosteroid isomerase-like protein
MKLLRLTTRKALRLAMLVFAALCIAGLALAQAPVPKAEQDELTATVTALDAKLFNAYNHCDLKTLGEMVSDDLEFYHDQTGLAVGKAPFVASIQQNICGKVERTIAPGTLEAHVLNHFGAVEIVNHYFHKPGQPADQGGEARAVMLWQKTGDTWLLTRVISYDHVSIHR